MEEGGQGPEEQTRTASTPESTQQQNQATASNPALDMGALLEQYEQDSQRAQVRRNDFVEGTVVMVDRDGVLVDIGGKMEAVIPRGEIPLEDDEIPLKRGDHIGAVVIAGENSEGRPVLSIHRAKAEVGWRDLQTKFDTGEILDGEVVDYNKGGLIVLVDGVRGFVPLSQIVDLKRGGSEEQVDEKLKAMRGQQLFLKVIEIQRRRNRLILSERAASQERRSQLKDQLLAELQQGEIRHGRVSSLTDFGAFVDLGGADGLIHLSELSWGQVVHPSQVLKVGQDVDVRVVGVDRDNKKIALSLKQVEENPWSRIEEKYHIGDTVTAKVTKLAQFGAFAEIEPGVEGLVHISELSEERITHPKQVVREGEDVQVKVIKIDSQRHRIGLSLRQVEYAAGDDEFGAFEDWGDAPDTSAAGDAAQATA
ncbi:MAG: S1 RNA-binding domain-containing protein [Chloroflexi bacterium]|nr:S1 RNA-binding domain-containing protein [Chloroflexota bacterium]